jgi:hypothetical protein
MMRSTAEAPRWCPARAIWCWTLEVQRPAFFGTEASGYSGRLLAVEIYGPGQDAEVMFGSISLFRLTADDVIRRLSAVTTVRVDEGGYGVTAPDLLLALWRGVVPKGPDDEDGRHWQSVLMAKPGYYDTPTMSTVEPTPRQVAIKVSPEGGKLITSGAHYLRMSKKDLVEAAVEFYLNARREEMQAGMRELLSQLDGSRGARVALLAGMTREELESVGGVEEDD